LNSRPPVPQTGALTGLRYAPLIGADYSYRLLAAQAAENERALAHRGATTYRVIHLLHRPPQPGLLVKRLLSATINSLRAFAYGFANETALREEMLLLVAGVLLGFVIAPSVAWYVMMIGSLLVLMSIEFLNTAVEKLADHVTPEQHVDIGRIKDYGSAAVFCAICLAGLIWLAALALRCGLI
jgi:diacylglycerol kinase (ATP)